MMRLLLVPLCLVLFVSQAAAASFSFAVNTGSPLTAPGVTLNGVDQPKTFTIANNVAYTGGSNNAGWKVQASATIPTSGAKTLPALTVTAGAFACVSGCTTNPTNAIVYPLTLTTTAQTIYNAALTTGRGTFTVTNTYQLKYVANALPGTYTSTITLTGSTGP